VFLAVFCATPIALAAQAAYSAANGDASIIPINFGFLNAEFAEVKLGLTFTQRLDRSCEWSDCVPDQFNFSVYMSAAARKDQQSMFSKLDFDPGFDIGGRVAYILQRDGPGYDVFYVGGGYTSQTRQTIGPDVVPGFTALNEVNQSTFAASVGFNHAFSEVTIVGVGVEGRRELSSPGIRRASEFCTPGSAGGGFRVLVCRDRFEEPLSDYWSGQARMDLSIKVIEFGAGAHAPRLGILSAASVDWLEGADEAVNFAIGPSVHVAGYPGHVVGAVLFGLQDAFDANGLHADSEGSYMSDHFLVRMVIGVPFEVMVGN
jgi:hypothetical protein